MKVYVLARSEEANNLTPEVFTTKEKAIDRMRDYCQTEQEDFADIIFSIEVYDESAEIVYRDDSYVVFEVFEAEVEQE